MAITKRDLDHAHAEYKVRFGGSKEDYFALLHLTREFEKTPEQVARHVAFGEEVLEGINAFHVDINRRILYLFCFQWSEEYQSFREPMRCLAYGGMEKIFGTDSENTGRLVSALRDRLLEDEAAIDKVFIQFVFNGHPNAAEQSAALDALREDLEARKHLIDRRFHGRDVSLTVQFVSNELRGGRSTTRQPGTHRYPLAMEQPIESRNATGERLTVGLVPLTDLYAMYKGMGQRLFERNIRAGLDPDGPINKKIRAALADVVEGRAAPAAFVFHHNGVTIAAETLEPGSSGGAHITEPRVLNGAQTITSLARFIETAEDGLDGEGAGRLREVRVLAKVVTGAAQPFITAVTINTNRQNPVEPANLRASDQIQLELQDKFRDELGGLLYERQESLFSALSDEEKAEQGFDPSLSRSIEIKRLAKTFLAAQGELDRMSRLNDVFETESQYRACFPEKYLKADARKILLAYKVQFRLNRVAREIEEAAKGYWYVPRAKNLLWALLVQGLLNHPKLDDLAEAYGTALRNEADFTGELLALGVSKVRHIIKQAVSEPKYKEQLEQERLSFLRTRTLYLRSMEVAAERYDWRREGF